MDSAALLRALSRPEFIERFWAFVQKSDGCWEWSGVLRAGYGSIGVYVPGFKQSRLVNAHRVSWLIHHGEIQHGLKVLHECDNRKCVNPAHLFLGTLSDNTKDMWNKGRRSHRLVRHSAIVRADVASLAASGLTTAEIVARTGVPRSTVQRIVKREMQVA